ncbi:uncharacterized protein LOC18430762 isoform X2 [Amborella trichopoda]|uniref:uncharacterized protein LOC18430762 isoform X2 n=1 Tax=Amborella trichopoda TaxID=13333 RepID=UPI0009C185C6|nr:uncharacterized protein LOC18430762 isoform X2 [Amborella trichopoda]|eukprot:XP_020520803.1 uncharacterized protein LOC18430762 isoform X2 [Amborella trichopoda]
MGDPTEKRDMECLFQWDEPSQLYYHASSGFYHDPNAGWYYSSLDGCYYTFENGNYVPMESNKDPNADLSKSMSPPELVTENPCNMECDNSYAVDDPCPPSEWLEETLINLYLMGYPNSETANKAKQDMPDIGTDSTSSNQCLENVDHGHCKNLEPENSSSEDLNDGDHTEEIEAEWIPEHVQNEVVTSSKVSSCEEENQSWDEEKWRAQYGQVVQSLDECTPSTSTVDLWDWALVTKASKRKNRKVVWLVGRLVRRSAKLHPSMCGLLKTAAVSETHLDLVRVNSGKVYRLRSPSAKYLTSLSSYYDSSNPTKDWGFPDFCVREGGLEPEASDIVFSEDPSSGQDHSVTAQKNHIYVDRAAERRKLHGGFGIGPGQKSVKYNVDEVESCSGSTHSGEALAEALDFSFGPGSYSRRLLEGMGWKEGQALGKGTKGLLEPLQAVGNKGSAGLGWKSGRV